MRERERERERETSIEHKLINYVKKTGGKSEKFDQESQRQSMNLTTDNRIHVINCQTNVKTL